MLNHFHKMLLQAPSYVSAHGQVHKISSKIILRFTAEQNSNDDKTDALFSSIFLRENCISNAPRLDRNGMEYRI